MPLHLHDLLPRPGGGFRGARPGVLAAAAERVILEQMLSVGLTAQARMLQNGPARAAEGWSNAEEGVHRAARALNLLATASAKLVKTYREDQRFADDREYGEIRPEPRLETIAEQVIYSTDPKAPDDERERRLGQDAYRGEAYEYIRENAIKDRAYLEETVERLRRYEPDWLTPDQHRRARQPAEAAAAAPSPQRQEDEPQTPDPGRANAEKHRLANIEREKTARIVDAMRLEQKREAEERREASARAEKAAYAQQKAAKAAAHANRKRAKTEERYVAPAPAADTISGPPAPDIPADPPEPDTVPAADANETPPSRRRGAQPGNVLSLKTGRHTAQANADRAEDRAMLKEVRALCAEVDELTSLKAGAG